MPVLNQTAAATPPRDKASRSRMAVLDTLRGLALLSMAMYHLCYNLDSIFGVSLPWFYSAGAALWQLVTSGMFLLLAGMCTHFTRYPARRALRVGVAAALITLATLLFVPHELIVFGILHCMTWCLLIYAGGQRLLQRIPPRLGLVLCVLLYAATFHVPQGYLLFAPVSVALPAEWYLSYWLSVLGFRSPDFYSADYFPLLPNLFVFLAGHYLGSWLPRLSGHIKTWSVRPFAFLGRHSMTVYLLHQPILFGILWLAFR